jgi:stage III sporulation protein AE
MNKLIITMILACAVAYFTAPDAAGTDISGAQSDALRLDELRRAAPAEAREALGDMTVMDALEADKPVNKLLGTAAAFLREAAGQALGSVSVLVAAAALGGIVGTALGGSGSNYAELAAILAISAISVGDVRSFIGIGADTVEELDSFSKMLIPTLTAAAAGSGAVTSAAAKYAATMLFVNLSISLSKNVVLPLIYAYAAASVADAATGGGAARGVAELALWLAKTVMTVSVFAFVAYITLVGTASGPSDELAMRAAKTAISALPVVGSVAAEAAGAVVSGASAIRNAVGIFGALTIAGICALPFMRLGVNYLIYKAAGGLAGAFASDRAAKLISAVGAAFGMILGMTGMAAVMIFISIISFTRAVA